MKIASKLLPLLVTLLLVPSVQAQEVRTLDEVCGVIVSVDTIVTEAGRSGSFGGCRITVEGARLELNGASLRGRLLVIRGQAGAHLSVIGSRLATNLKILGRFNRISLADTLVDGELHVDAAARGHLRIIRCTFRGGPTQIEIDPGSIIVSDVKFEDPVGLVTGIGGIEVRSSDVRAGLDASSTGLRDVALLNTTTRGVVELSGLGQVLAVANTILPIGNRRGRVELDGDINLTNSDIEIKVELYPRNSLLVVSNSFNAGRPSIASIPTNCIALNNSPRISCRATQ